MDLEKIKSWMNSNGYSMVESIGGYWYCVRFQEDGSQKIVWMDSACEDAYNLESATFVAYDIINS